MVWGQIRSHDKESEWGHDLLQFWASAPCLLPRWLLEPPFPYSKAGNAGEASGAQGLSSDFRRSERRGSGVSPREHCQSSRLAGNKNCAHLPVPVPMTVPIPFPPGGVRASSMEHLESQIRPVWHGNDLSSTLNFSPCVFSVLNISIQSTWPELWTLHIIAGGMSTGLFLTCLLHHPISVLH